MDIIINNYLTIYSIIAIITIFVVLIAAILKKTMITYGLIFANFFVFVLTLIFADDILGVTYVNVTQSRIIIDYAGFGFSTLSISRVCSSILYYFYIYVCTRGFSSYNREYAHIFLHVYSL